MTPADFRARFPGAGRAIYVDAAARGLLSLDAREALDRYLDERMMEGGDKAAMFVLIERLRARFAAFIGAAEDEIALTKNVSEGLNAIIAAFDWRRGDRIVYCPELEHPNNVYPWRHLVERKGVQLVPVPAEDGEISAHRVVEAIDRRTRMVSVSSVTFAPGLVTDIATIGRACRERQVLFLVDAVQSVGLLATDVHALEVDALAVSTQKGLLALYGMGFLFCRREWAERLEPAYLARFSVDLGDAHEADVGERGYILAPGARRFEVGNYNFAGAAAAQASLALLDEISAPVIERHVRSLAERLASGLDALGLPLVGPPAGPARGSMVCIGSLGAGGHDSTDDARMESLHAHWQANGVRLSIRRGLLRLSLHAYNDANDVEQLLTLAGEWVRSHDRARTG